MQSVETLDIRSRSPQSQQDFECEQSRRTFLAFFLPAFESYTEDANNDFGLTGLGKGGQQVQRCRETYARAVETLVELASLQVRPIRNEGRILADLIDCFRHLGRGH